MHELAVAQGLVSEAERVAAIHNAARIDHIVARVGVLSGVEAQLLERAFLVASAGTRADGATLEIETGAIEVRCRSCGATGVAAPNRLICRSCGDWQVDVTAGEELLLVRLALSGLPDEDGEGVGDGPPSVAAPASPTLSSCCASDAWSPLAARLAAKRQTQKQHDIHRVARVPYGSDICSEPSRTRKQMSEPEH